MGRNGKKASTTMIHQIEEIDFEGSYLLIKVDGRKHRIDLRKQSKRLADAEESAKRNFAVSPSGYGIHWPEIGEDLSINGMIGVSQKIKTRKKT